MFASLTNRINLAATLATTFRRGWRWWLTSIALIALLAAMVGFIWLSQRFESEQKQNQQIADTLWVEQSIRFQMVRNVETLQLLGRDLVSGRTNAQGFQTRAAQLLRGGHEFVSLYWLDGAGRPLAHSPVEAAMLSANTLHLVQPLLQTDNQNIQPFYVQVAAPGDRKLNKDQQVDLLIPLPGPDATARAGGVLVARFALGGLLEEMVPWWFAQTNEVLLTDQDNNVLARRAPGGKGRSIYTHTIQLDLPGTSLNLRTNSIQDSPGLLPNMVATAAVLLSLTLMWSLWALRRDMQRRAEAEQALREQHAFRKAMEDSLLTGLRARDLEGRMTYVNPAFCKMVGYTPEELLGHLPPLPYWVPDAIEDHQRRFALVMAGGAPAHGYEAVFQHKDGHRINALLYEAPLINAQGVQTGWMSSVLDVTERKRMEELNRQQHEKLQTGARLATMGEIASTLSHELNQPLAAITSYAAGCLNLIERNRLEPVADLHQELNEAIVKIQTQSQRAGMIIRSVHDLLKKREPTRTPCDLASLIRSTLPLIELQSKKYQVRIITDLPEQPIRIHADRIMLEQVLLNLTRNAIDAMQETPLVQRAIHIEARLVDDTNVQVSVSDRGPGISLAVQEQLFTPFFSTKAEGMGMGLAICRSAIEFHGGRLEYEANPKGGAVFKFTLPVMAAATAAQVITHPS